MKTVLLKRILRSFLCLLLASMACAPAARLPASAQGEDPDPPSLTYLPAISRQITFLPRRLGPDYGRVLGVGRDAASPSVFYAMTYGSGIYKSADGGASWEPASAGITYLTIQSMAVDPVTPNTLYAGTYGDDSVPYSGVFKSASGGASWQPTGVLSNYWNGVRYSTPVVYALAVDPLNPQRVFAGTRMKGLPDGSLGGGGVFRSENGGASWQPVNSGLPYDDLYVYDLGIDPAHPGRVYAALHEHGLYRSENYGESWRAVGGTPYAGRAVAVDPFAPSTIYFGAMKKLGIHRSDNEGGSWLTIGDGRWDNMVGALSPDPYHAGALFAGVLVDNTSYRLMRSGDYGDTWETAAHLDTWGKIAFSQDGRTLLVAVDFEGPHRSTDGGRTWARSARGLSGYSVTGLAVSPSDPDTLHAGLYWLGVFTSTNGGATWTKTSSGLENTGILALAGDPRNAALLYVTTDQSGVYRSTNGGQSWSALSGGYPAASSAAPAPAGELKPAPFDNRPLPEREDLLDHPEQPARLAMAAPTGRAVGNAIAVSPHSSAVVLVGTSGRGIYRLSGSTWAATSRATGTVYSLLFDRSVPGRVLAGMNAGSGGLLSSANNGQTWAASNTGLSGRTVYSLAQSPGSPAYFLAGTDSGVYRSADGVTWTSIGLAGQAVKAVGAQEDYGGLLLAGTDTSAYYFDIERGAWTALGKPLENAGIQGIIPLPGGRGAYFITRLAGTVRVDAR